MIKLETHKTVIKVSRKGIQSTIRISESGKPAVCLAFKDYETLDAFADAVLDLLDRNFKYVRLGMQQ